MNNVLLHASLKDKASPVIKKLSSHILKLNTALGSISNASKSTDGALNTSIKTFVRKIARIGEAIESLVSLRVVTALVGGTFKLLTVSLSISIAAMGLMVQAINTTMAVATLLPPVFRAAQTAVVGAFVAMRLAATTLTRKVLIVSAVVAAMVTSLFLIKSLGSVAFDVLKIAVRKFGEALTEVTTGLLPAFLQGVGGKIWDLAATVIRTTAQVIDKYWASVGGNAASQQALTKVKKVAALLGDVWKSVASGAKEDARKSLAEFGKLAGGMLQTVVSAVSSFSSVILAARSLNTLEFSSFLGTMKLTSGTVAALWASAFAAIKSNAIVTKDAIMANLGKIKTGLSTALLTLYDNLPDASRAQGIIGGLIKQFSDSGLKAQLTAEVEKLIKAVAEPANAKQLAEGTITPTLQIAIESYQKASSRIVGIYEKMQKRLGIIERTGAEQRRHIQIGATINQARSFTQAAGGLIGQNKKLAIALATVDAGLAIIGAIKHGAGFGPVYLAFYVATVAATLASTIASIKSGSVPSAVSGSTATPPDSSQQQRQISVTLFGDNFSAGQVESLIQKINDEENGRTGQLAV